MTVERVLGLLGPLKQPASLPAGSGDAQSAPLPGSSGGRSNSGEHAGADVEVDVQTGSTAVHAVVSSSTKFLLDPNTGLITIEVVNSSSGELIRKIPIRDYVQLTLGGGTPIGTLFEART